MPPKYLFPKYLFKVLSYSLWEQSLGKEALMLPPEDDAFIHLSTHEQLERILVKFWAHIPKYMILKIETKKLPGELVFETNPNGSTKYYHLYNGHIPRLSIVDAKMCMRKL